MGAIATNLQRMRELSVQAANGTNSGSDRAALQAEVAQLTAEINRVSSTTQFNGLNLLDGSFTNSVFQVGANSAQTISLTVASASASTLGGNAVAGLAVGAVLSNAKAGAANNVDLQTLTVSGNGASSALSVAAGASAKTIAAQVNAVQGTTGVTATAVTTATVAGIVAGTASLSLKGSNSTAITVSATNAVATDLSAMVKAVNDQTGLTGITATSSGNNLVLTSATGDDINVGTADGAGVGANAATLAGADSPTTAVTLGAVGTGTTVGGLLSFDSASAFTVLSTTATIVAAATTASTLTSVGSLDISTQNGATSALKVIDSALAGVSSQRASLGAVQNRFESTVSNLQTSAENLSASRSRIQDADFAQETANLSRSQILQQAGTAMVAQANQLPQGVLALLR